MTERNVTPSRDDVLFAFHQECERPTASQIIEWIERYPQFADDIRIHAAFRRDWAAKPNEPALKPDDAMLSRGRSRALNAIYQAQQEFAAAQKPQGKTWPQLLSAAGYDIPNLARHIDIDRMVLAELNAGRMRPPVGPRLVSALASALKSPEGALNGAFVLLVMSPRRFGHANAKQQPTVNLRSYEEIILASSMSDERKKYWLDKN